MRSYDKRAVLIVTAGGPLVSTWNNSEVIRSTDHTTKQTVTETKKSCLKRRIIIVGLIV